MKIMVVVAEISSQMCRAHCPSLPGCVVLAPSRQEAAERLSRAISGYLASLDAAVPGKIELEVLGARQASDRPTQSNCGDPYRGTIGLTVACGPDVRREKTKCELYM